MVESDPLVRCAIVVVAYEAAGTVTEVLDRIPCNVAERVGAVLVSDDASRDDTTVRCRGWGALHPRVAITTVRQPVNLGYGGNQRFCYCWALTHGFDHVVMIHGDGQYAPELAEWMLAPLIEGRAEAVFGSRMLDRHGARLGGMPLYKRIGNRVLTAFQNRVAGLGLSEWHSGYRAYSLRTLATLDLDALSAGFDFDTQIILAVHGVGGRIIEIPIPTRYGDEICRVNGMRYAGQVSREVVRHRRRARSGFVRE